MLVDENMTREEYREEELRDALHEHNLYDFDYYFDNEVTDAEHNAIKIVSKLLKEIKIYHDGITFGELEEMV